jgi:periplasmic protein TonB
MFGDTLLESSSALRKRKRWPMAAAFTGEVIIAAIVVIVPLLSTGVIPLSARPVPVPVTPVIIERVKPIPDGGNHPSGTTAAPKPAVVLVNDNKDTIRWKSQLSTTRDVREVTPPEYVGGPNKNAPTGPTGPGPATSNVVLDGPKRIVSVLSEAQLLNRVEPVYPRIAVLTGVQGQVKLHAIIARDGTIQSLNVISGHPLLVRAAAEAVGQWRYRPYILNGEAVEVETFITVNFRKDAH